MSKAPPSLAQSWSLSAEVETNENPKQGSNSDDAKVATVEEVAENEDSPGSVEDIVVTSTEKTDEVATQEADVASAEKTDGIPTDDKGADSSSEENFDENSTQEQDSEVTKEEPEQETVEEKPIIKIETAPADFRFPTTNQTRHCFTRYIEYHRCIQAKGDGAPECDKFAKYYRSLCPSEWVERWNEQRENGTFPGPL